MNMVNYEDTPLYVVYEQVRALAERYGTYIVDSEIVGLTPAKAMIDCAEFYLRPALQLPQPDHGVSPSGYEVKEGIQRKGGVLP